MEKKGNQRIKRELGLAAIKAIDEGLAELKKLLEGLEQEQKQEKERPIPHKKFNPHHVRDRSEVFGGGPPGILWRP